MRVPDQISNTVVFLGVLTGEGEKYVGTAFIVTVAYGPGHIYTFAEGGVSTTIRVPFAFLVTAKHIVDDLEAGELYVRANGKDGTVKTIKLGDNTKWWFHPTEKDSVDVAVAFFPPDSLYQLDFKPIPVTMFVATEETIQTLNLGIGDEVFVAGLFTKVMGQERNHPIIRTGTVAMMPTEKIPFRDKQIYAHLVECRSIGGLSGAPVFIRQTVSVPTTVDRFRPLWPPNLGPAGMEQPLRAELRGVGRFYFFGSMIGHWEVPQGFTLTKREAANMGIAPIVPAAKILEVISQQELVHEMHRINSEVLSRNEGEGEAVLDSAKSQDAPRVFTQQDFEDALKKVSRKTLPEK